jgi:hypothetical protein
VSSEVGLSGVTSRRNYQGESQFATRWCTYPRPITHPPAPALTDVREPRRGGADDLQAQLSLTPCRGLHPRALLAGHLLRALLHHAQRPRPRHHGDHQSGQHRRQRVVHLARYPGVFDPVEAQVSDTFFQSLTRSCLTFHAGESQPLIFRRRGCPPQRRFSFLGIPQGAIPGDLFPDQKRNQAHPGPRHTRRRWLPGTATRPSFTSEGSATLAT